MSEDREREDQEDRGWDALETEDEERLIPRERYEKQYPPILDTNSVAFKSAVKTAVWIFLASLPVAIIVAVLLVLVHYL
jgi:hypothetical protein